MTQHHNPYAQDGAEPAAPSKKKPWFKRWWAWTIAAFVIIGTFSSMAGGGGDSDKTAPETSANPQAAAEIEEPSATPDAAPVEAEPETPAEYTAALKKAEMYSNTMHMSKAGLYNQLTSEYGEKFSTEAAQYAVNNVNADWNANALAKAESYQQSMNMSPAAIRDQLVSEYGEKFTPEEADYAIQNLN